MGVPYSRFPLLPKEYVASLIGLYKTMVQFRVLEYIFSWSGHFTLPELAL